MKTEMELRTESPAPDPELVIREARRRQRRRRLVVSGTVVVLVAAGVLAARATSAGRSAPPAPPPAAKAPVHPANVPAPPPSPAPAVAAGRFAGTWRVHTTSVTIEADGTGTATWPGPITPGGSEATAVQEQAVLRLTSVAGAQAIGAVSGSTDQAELPDGPVRLQVTSQDLLRLVPTQSVTDTPLRWAALCGASALSLTVAQQVAAGINCGA